MGNGSSARPETEAAADDGGERLERSVVAEVSTFAELRGLTPDVYAAFDRTARELVRSKRSELAGEGPLAVSCPWPGCDVVRTGGDEWRAHAATHR